MNHVHRCLASILLLAGTNHLTAQCAQQWLGFGTGANDAIHALAPTADGGFVAGGYLTIVDGIAANRIARWDGAAWVPLGSGMNAQVNAVTVLPNGDIVAGGHFTVAGGVAADFVARWDGVQWSPMGSGMNAQVYCFATLPNGDLVAGGHFTMADGIPAERVARWDGTAWSPLGVGMDDTVLALTRLPNGDLVAGGAFVAVAGVPASRVARWNGSGWSAMGGGMNGQVQALATRPDGSVVAGGQFTLADGQQVNYVAVWDGVAWLPLGAGLWGHVYAFATLPGGDLVAGVTYPEGILRWDGSNWSGLAGANAGVLVLTTIANGDLIVGGHFQVWGTTQSPYLVRMTSTCPATATSYGVGCSGAGGAQLLTASTLPWVETAFMATATGLPTPALALALTSVTSYPQGLLPLSALFAEGVPGCDVLVAPDILELLVSTTGSAQSTLFLPNTPPLVGLTFFHQMVPIELDALGNFVAITATNALSLTAGVF